MAFDFMKDKRRRQAGRSAIAPPVAAFATWNPADKSANIGLTNGNLTATSTGQGLVRATAGRASGLYKFEVLVGTTPNATNQAVGFARSTVLTSNMLNVANTVSWLASGDVFSNGGPIGTFDTYAPGDTISIEIDIGSQQMFLQKVGGSGRSTAFNIQAGPFFPAFGPGATGYAVTANFGASAWAIAASPGYGGWPPT